MITAIYHRADFDGLFCREVVKKHLENHGAEYQLIGWDYGDPVPEVDPAQPLIMLDISIEELMDHPALTWIDHHKTAIEKYGERCGLQIDGVAACRLAWQWFFTEYQGPKPEVTLKDFIDRKVEEPEAVRLAGEYDIWDKRDPNVDIFQYGLQGCILTPTAWENLLLVKSEFPEAHAPSHIKKNHLAHTEVQRILQAGFAVKVFKEQECAYIIQNYGFDLQWEGLKFLAVNHAKFNSLLFETAVRDDHDALLGFRYDGSKKKWIFSLYGIPDKSPDLSEIAVKYGGGGHRHACGFAMDYLPEGWCDQMLAR